MKNLISSLAIVLCCSAILFAQNATEAIKVTNVSHLNSPNLDFSPVQYHQGLVFVSSNKRHGKMDSNINENAFDLMYADMGPKGKLSKPGPFSLKVNTRFHEGPVAFSSDMNTMYFTRSNTKNGNPVKDAKGIIRLKIYSATKGKEDWGNIQELPFNNDQFSCVHPSLSSDGQYLYFASDRPGGQGGMDLYYVKKRGNGWSEPVNLGTEINTADQEVFPYVHSSGKLFFASNQKGTTGGLDLFAVDFQEKIKGRVEKLPAPINSANDDLGLILSASGEVGFVASDRPGGKGKDDIYRLDIPGGLKGLFPPQETDLLVKVFNRETSEVLAGAKVFVMEIPEGGTAYEQDLFDVEVIKNKYGETLLRYSVKPLLFDDDKLMKTDVSGLATTTIKASRKYIVAVHKDGFTDAHRTYLTNDISMDSRLEIGLWPIPKIVEPEPEPPVLELGSIIILDQIFYDFGKSYIRTDASRGLDAVLQLMKDYPGMTIDLTAHTDSRGTKEFNLDLSVRRAASAKYYLTSRGIAENRIKAFGKGEQNPRNRCMDGVTCTEEEYQLNRRTEIKITGLGPDVRKIEYINNAPEFIDRAKSKKK